MDPNEDLTGGWRDAHSRAGVDAEVQADAYEVFVAEAGRSRLADRTGEARVRLRSGSVLLGTLGRSQVAHHLLLVDQAGRACLVHVDAVLMVVGSSPGLRPEPEPRLRSVRAWLRDAWLTGATVAALDASGAWQVGVLCHVGADHVDLVRDGERATLPLAAVAVWRT